MSASSNVYFADLPPMSEEFAAAVFTQMRTWQTWCIETGLDQRWMQNLALYHGADPKRFTGVFGQDAFQIMGSNGELLHCSFNDYRNILQNILNMTVNQPPNLTAKAINGDSASIVSAQTFDGVFAYYMSTYKNARLQRQSKIAVENALWSDIGYVLGEWDPSAGKPIAVQPGAPPMEGEEQQNVPVYEGDMYFKARMAWDVAFDPGEEDDEDGEWKCVRDQINKYELAAKYPEFRDEIIGTSAASQELYDWRRGFSKPLESNIIDYYKLYVRPSRSKPNGRRAVLLSSKRVLLDENNPYDIIPVFSVRAMEGAGGGPIGYGPGNVIASGQMASDVLTSSQMTNYAMFGTQNIAVKSTDDFDVSVLAGGMNVVKYNETPPQALMLAAQAGGIGDFHQMVRSVQEAIVGLNSGVRGDPAKNISSGEMLDTVAASAVRYNSPLASSYAQFLQNIGNFMLFVFRKYVKAERITQIVGTNDMLQAANWNGDTFGPIDRVVAELSDPAMRTLGYKTKLAFELADRQMLKTPQEVITVITTGQFKPLIQYEVTQNNLVHQENEDMLKTAPKVQEWIDANGMQQVPDEILAQFAPPVILADEDPLHQAEHGGLISSPAVRRNSALLQLVLYHDRMHDQNIITKLAKQQIDQALVQQKVNEVLGPPPMPAPGQPQPAPEQQPQQLA